MTKPITVEIAPEFLTSLEAAPPRIQAQAREMVANLRQAVQAVNDGRYETVDDAIEAITGKRPVPLSELGKSK
jgi:hypothetical protein